MTTRYQNPFSDTRVETATGAQLLARHAAVLELEEPGNCLLIGTRGSGKTSALLCLGWEERARNISLRKELASDRPEFISVYSKLHHHVSAAIHTIPWGAVVGPQAVKETAYEYFSLLIELLAAELLITAIVRMRAEGFIHYLFDAEVGTADALSHIVRKSGFHISSNGFTDLASCAAWCRDYRLETHKFGSRHLLNEALSALPSTRPGQFLHDVVRMLEQFLKLPTSANKLPESFHFKVCFDEAETLTSEQQVFLNTLIRQSSAPLFWVIATVDRNFETTETIELGQSLTSADRQVIYLDYQAHMSGFKDFAEQIASLRIKNALGCYKSAEPTEFDDVQVRFDYLFDHFSVNSAIARLIETRKSVFVQELREWAEEFESEFAKIDRASSRTYPRNRGKQQRRSKIPRFYESYLIKKLFPTRRLSELIPGDRDQRDNVLAALRRKQFGALLCIVREGRFAYVPYFGAESLLKLADGNIRELLEILEVVFENVASKARSNPLMMFVGRGRDNTIKWVAQRKAFSVASEAKLNGITNRHAEVGGSVSTLIRALGYLTYHLQSDYESLGSLRTAERGNFTFDLSELSAMHNFDRESVIERTREVIDRCIEDSLLKEAGSALAARPVGQSRGLYQIRVHQRFAPFFRTSLRGAYAVQRIPARLIAEICVAPAGINALEWANRAFDILRASELNTDQGEFDWAGVATGELQ
jgi:hypothetical protein